jgi:hypothetical protein
MQIEYWAYLKPVAIATVVVDDFGFMHSFCIDMLADLYKDSKVISVHTMLNAFNFMEEDLH